MFIKGSETIINESFKQSMLQSFNILTIKEYISGPCILNPPYLNNPLPIIKISFCGLLQYQIPADTFKDKEDGDTRNLDLSLVEWNGSQISMYSVVQFDKKTQTIIGVLASKTVGNIRRDLKYKVLVKDSSNLHIEHDINVQISGDPKPVSYQILLISHYVASSGNENKNPAYIFGAKIGSYFKDNAGRFFSL